jgi:hypothetical protein
MHQIAKKWVLMGSTGFFCGFSIKKNGFKFQRKNVPDYLLRLGVIFLAFFNKMCSQLMP